MFAYNKYFTIDTKGTMTLAVFRRGNWIFGGKVERRVFTVYFFTFGF